MLKTLLMLVVVAAPLVADTRFTVRQMTRGDVPSGTGQCDIRLRVDNEAEVRVGGTEVMVIERAGAPTRDEGSECNYPLPRNPRNLRFEVHDKDDDGDVRLAQQPGSGRGGRAIVYIRDPDGGAHRYHFRFKWDLDGSGGDWNSGGGGWNDNDDWGGGDWNNPGGDTGRAVSLCQDEVRRRLEGRYRGQLNFRGQPNIDSQNRNRTDVEGRAVFRDGSGRRGRITYNCRVNVRNGRVLQADYRVEDRGNDRGNTPW